MATSRLQDLYKKEVRPKLLEKLGLKNLMEVPSLSKVVINVGVRGAVSDSKSLNIVKDVISKIAGQSAVKTKAKKSIAGFKLREGVPIGVMVTLRNKNMYDFLDKLINIAMPCVRDFRGLSYRLDGNGNYNIGIKDWFIFSEVDYDKVDTSSGFNITIETSSSSDEHAYELLKSLNMPFKARG
jgi:large subunit ribosomal protein L5